MVSPATKSVALQATKTSGHPTWGSAGPILIGDICQHTTHGRGRVRSVEGDTVLVRFSEAETTCELSTLSRTIECLISLVGEQDVWRR